MVEKLTENSANTAVANCLPDPVPLTRNRLLIRKVPVRSPKCGSLDIYFDKRRFGRVGYAGSMHRVSYHKIGICRKCGYTWRPEFQRHSSVSIWLWVLGWVCIFPVPLTVLLNRQKKINKSLKTIIVVLSWLMYTLILVTSYLPYFQNM